MFPIGSKVIYTSNGLGITSIYENGTICTIESYSPDLMAYQLSSGYKWTTVWFPEESLTPYQVNEHN